MGAGSKKQGEVGGTGDGASAARAPKLVRAAGGIPVRQGAAGLELLLVHRPRYDDWTFPKGKLDPGETEEQCAVREVLEETGLRVELGNDLASVHYVDHRGRPKTVHYWVMSVVGGEFVPNDEVDEICWLPIEPAAERLTYGIDEELLAHALPLLG